MRSSCPTARRSTSPLRSGNWTTRKKSPRKAACRRKAPKSATPPPSAPGPASAPPSAATPAGGRGRAPGAGGGGAGAGGRARPPGPAWCWPRVAKRFTSSAAPRWPSSSTARSPSRSTSAFFRSGSGAGEERGPALLPLCFHLFQEGLELRVAAQLVQVRISCEQRIAGEAFFRCAPQPLQGLPLPTHQRIRGGDVVGSVMEVGLAFAGADGRANLLLGLPPHR